jgi:hypothetical protein
LFAFPKCYILQGKGQYFQSAKNGEECWTLHGCCTEGPMVRWLDEAELRELCKRDRDVYVRDDGVVLKRSNPPNSMFPGGIEYVVGHTDSAAIRSARLHRERVEQELKAIRQALAETHVRSETMIDTVIETADTAVANKPLSAFRSNRELLAEAMQKVKEWPHGIPPKGMGWKKADRVLKPPHGGVIGSKSAFYRARNINVRLAARQSQG